jgi:fructose-1,6-bisphosphatase/inositol monophosphatase family enzyme
MRVTHLAPWAAADGPPAEALVAALELVDRLAEETRAIVLARLATGFRFERKPDRSLVSEIDLAVEAMVRERLARELPDHAVLGEEGGLVGAQPGAPFPDWLWAVDPIDGTHSLCHRVPLFGSLFALLWRGQPVLGAIDLPLLGRRLCGAVGLGARRDGQPLRLHDLDPAQPLGEEIVSTGERGQFVRAGLAASFDRLLRTHPRTRTYCDCFGHALALEGAVGAMVDPDLRLWDAAASLALARTVGAAVAFVAPDGAPEAGAGLDPERRYHLVFGKPAVVAHVLELLAAGEVEQPGRGGSKVP